MITQYAGNISHHLLHDRVLHDRPAQRGAQVHTICCNHRTDLPGRSVHRPTHWHSGAQSTGKFSRTVKIMQLSHDSCYSDSDSHGDGDSGSDSHGDGDSGSDSDGDGDSDSDGDGDSDSHGDGGSDSNSDGDSGNDNYGYNDNNIQ